MRVRDAATPQQAAKRFVESTFHLSFAGDAPARLMMARDTDTLGGHRFIYQLYYVRTDTRVALPIPGNVVIVNVTQDTLISYASNDTVPISNPIVIRTSSAMPRGAAEKAAVAQHDGAVSIAAASQIIAVSKGTPVLLWKINLLRRSPAGSFEVLLDGATGRVVSSRNNAVFKD